MKLVAVNSSSAPAAVGGYAQGLRVEGPGRLLFISGQIPESREGVVPDDFAAQAQQVWANVRAQLAADSMTVANLVKVTIFLSSREFAAANREARLQALGSHMPALTVVLAGIFDDRWLLEIEAIAAA